MTVMSLLAEGKITAEDAAALMVDHDAKPGAGSVAALGAAVRMPGASDLEELWSRLIEATSLVGPFPAQRFDLVAGVREELAGEFGHYRERLDSDSRSIGGWITGIEQFDPGAFGFSDFEAEFMGPAERLLLQVTDEALALSGIRADGLRGTRTGVFGGYQPNERFEYLRLFGDPDERAFISNIPANALYRIAYTYDLRGPVMSIDTTCSSSLAALHQARRALQAGECDLAIVVGASLSLFPFWSGESDYFIKSPHHRCASYDAAADGITWGEGVIAVVLKRTEDAVRDRDYISALVTGSAINSDGASNGMPAPNPDAHRDVVRAALAEAGVSASQIGYVEGHGTGTVLGDVTEVDALTRAFRADTDESGYCRLGSIKAVIGHLGDSAGLAGFLEALLCLRKRRFPALAGLKRPNPAIDWERTPFVVSGDDAPWPDPSDGSPRRAAVSSLGLSGTNVHVILEEPVVPASTEVTTEMTPIFISAKTRWALWELIRRLAEEIDEDAAVRDIAYTLARRGMGPARIGVFASDAADLVRKLGQLLSMREFERIPEHLGDQQIFPSDSAAATEYSLGKLATVDSGGVAPDDITLMTEYLKHAEVDDACLRRLERGRTIALPLAPMTTRRIWPAAKDWSADVSHLFFRPEWTEVDMVAEGAPARGTWVVLAHEGDATAEAVARKLRGGGSAAILVTTANRFSRLGSHHYGIAFDSSEDYDRLWRSVGPLEELTGIVHMLGRESGEDPMATARALEASQHDGAFSLFHLAQSLIRLDLAQPMLMAVVASRAQQVIPGEDCAPPRVTGFGFLKVFSQEVPHIAELAIDHDFSGSDVETADQIVAEVSASPRERLPLVAYRGGRRYTKLVGRASDEGGGTALTIREGGTYVIVGGTGYLGMQVGRFLADQGAGAIVLLSRGGLPPRETWGSKEVTESPDLSYKIDAIRQMEEAGASVRVLRCDITDESAVEQAFADIRSAFGSVHGGFMLAKELFHLWIGELDFERFRRGIDNRVRGTWLFSEQLRQDEPDFLVLFSSISSLTGTKGAAECAAVNQYLDALSSRLTATGVPTYTLNLPLILDDKSGFAAKSPIPPIDFFEFRASLERFFRDAHPVDIVVRLDLEEVHYLREVLRIPFTPDVWREAAEHVAQGADDGEAHVGDLDETQIKRALTEAWRATLGMSAVDPNANFFTAGGTSLSAVRLVHLIGKSMPAVGFDVAALYGNATFAAQVDYCTSQLKTEADDPAASMESIFARVECGELSEEEAAELLSLTLATDESGASWG
jgi:3-oxoacyl-(acyl-carrier-protein) synthase/NAD(P)-dependent dehydrogenase (short-subunit alcohol dehydrogenase family)